jgi:hypothetical protein
MALGTLAYAIGVALTWLSQHPTIQRLVSFAVIGGIRTYNGLPPKEKAEVDRIVEAGIKLVVKLGLSDAADWTRVEIHTHLPNLPDSVADIAAQAVEKGGNALLNAAADKKRSSNSLTPQSGDISQYQVYRGRRFDEKRHFIRIDRRLSCLQLVPFFISALSRISYELMCT